MTNSIKSILLASVLLVAPLAAQARIVDCPKNGRPYNTVTGYYVDVPGTAQYVAPSRRSSGRPSRRSSSYSGQSSNYSGQRSSSRYSSSSRSTSTRPTGTVGRGIITGFSSL